MGKEKEKDTPKKKDKDKLHDMLSTVVDDIKSIKEDIQSIRNTDLEAIKADIAGLGAGIDFANKAAKNAMEKAEANEESINELTSEVDEIKASLLKSQSENKKLKEHLLKTEAQERRSNLIIDGINESEENCFLAVQKILDEKLEIEDANGIKIERCHRMGTGPKPRPIIFRLHFYPDRDKIWKARRKLKDTGLWLREDFPMEIAKRRQVLEPIRKAAAQQGKKAFLTYDKLIIDGTSYTVDTTHLLPSPLKPEEVATKRGEGFTAFFSRSSPLSNFASCLFKGSDGTKYTSSEQYYQRTKAIFHGDPITASLIMKTDDPAECKRLGEKIQIKNPETWKERSLDVMFDGCFAKFNQSIKLKTFLLSTKDDVLIEANPRDTFWGVGLSFNHKDILTPSAWKGENNLGKVLRKVRERLADKPLGS